MRNVLFLCLCGAVLTGCGAKLADDLAATVDGGDAGLADGSVPTDVGFDARPDGSPDARPDTRPDSTPPPPPDGGPFVCDTPPGPGFVCPPAAKKGAKVCNDAAIRAILAGCFGAGASGESCSDARAKFASCGGCMLGTFLVDPGFIDIGACMAAVDPKSPCGARVGCTFTCYSETCASCDFSPGPDGFSEFDECLERASEPPGAPGSGACWELGGKDYAGCTEDPKFAVCVPFDEAGLLPFYRGACRDGGNWSKASTADGT
jgi:hypothetical protein